MCCCTSYNTHHVVHPGSCDRQYETDSLGALTHLWSQQSDGCCPYTHDSYPIFLAAKKTSVPLAYSYALYHGHYFYFFNSKSPGILCSEQYSTFLHQSYHDISYNVDGIGRLTTSLSKTYFR